MKYLTLALLLLTGCAEAVPTREIASELEPYVAEFEKQSGLDVNNIIMRFDSEAFPLPERILGRCEWTSDEYAPVVVIIHAPFWNSTTEEKRNSLVFHELGHCTLRQDHRDGNREDGCPKSVMNTYALSQYCLEEHWLDYVFELLSFKK